MAQQAIRHLSRAWLEGDSVEMEIACKVLNSLLDAAEILSLKEIAGEKFQCSVTECSREKGRGSGHGMCYYHYRRWYDDQVRSGHVPDPTRRRRRIEERSDHPEVCRRCHERICRCHARRRRST